ncbi:MAG: transposase [Acidobacteria bacterium]|nr:transposase [Acidobacteriota bacterium]
MTTNNRWPFLHNASVRTDLNRRITNVRANLHSLAVRVGGMDDHIHLLCSHPKKSTVSELTEQIKPSSSKWLKGLKNRDPKQVQACDDRIRTTSWGQYG